MQYLEWFVIPLKLTLDSFRRACPLAEVYRRLLEGRFFGYPLEKVKGPFVCVSIKRNRSFRKLGLDRENIKFVTLYSRSKVDSRRYLRLQDFTDRSLPFYNG